MARTVHLEKTDLPVGLVHRPEGFDRGGIETVADAHRPVTGEENDSTVKPFANRITQISKMACVLSTDRCPSLDLDRRDTTVASFQNEVDLAPVTVAVVIGTRCCLRPAKLPTCLANDKVLQQLPAGGFIASQRRCRSPRQVSS